MKCLRTLSTAKVFSIIIVIVFIALSILTVSSMIGDVYGDEYVFIRITENLPNSSTSADWLLIDHPELVNLDVSSEKFYHLAYDTKVWVHPLLPNYLMYPLFKVIDPMKANVARVIPLSLMFISVLLMVDIIRRKFNLTLAGLSVLPFLFSNQLLGGGLWLYYDAFMIMFFILSLWIIYTKPDSKWLYVAITAMLLSKEMGLFYMLPLLIAYYQQTGNIKHTASLVLPIMAIIAWVIYTGVISGDILYVWHHWEALKPTPNIFNMRLTMEYIKFYLINWGLAFYFVITIPGFIFVTIASIKTKNNAYLPFMLFYVIAICCAAGWGLVPYHLHSVLYAGMMMAVLSISLFFKDAFALQRE